MCECEKHRELCREIKKLWNVEYKTIPTLVAALDTYQ